MRSPLLNPFECWYIWKTLVLCGLLKGKISLESSGETPTPQTVAEVTFHALFLQGTWVGVLPITSTTSHIHSHKTVCRPIHTFGKSHYTRCRQMLLLLFTFWYFFAEERIK